MLGGESRKARAPTTTGKIERFHRSLRAEFLSKRRLRESKDRAAGSREWVAHYNNNRPHQALRWPHRRIDSLLAPPPRASRTSMPVARLDVAVQDWVSRRVSQRRGVRVLAQVSVGRHYAGQRCDVHVDGDCCGSGSATTSSKPRAAPAPARYETNGPCAPAHRPKPQHRVSRINRHRNVNYQPTLNRGTVCGIGGRASKRWSVARRRRSTP